MIRYMQGTLKTIDENRILLLAGGIGYEILLPEIVRRTFQPSGNDNATVELYISYQQTQQQPKPVLIGFAREIELEFFEHLIRVKDIGPVMASRALTMPVPVIARAIEDRDVTTLTKLNGIGKRKAEMIISELNGKVGKYALMKEEQVHAPGTPEDVSQQVVEVLVKQLGHSKSEAVKMVKDAVERVADITSPEELFEEVYRGTRNIE